MHTYSFLFVWIVLRMCDLTGNFKLMLIISLFLLRLRINQRRFWWKIPMLLFWSLFTEEMNIVIRIQWCIHTFSFCFSFWKVNVRVSTNNIELSITEWYSDLLENASLSIMKLRRLLSSTKCYTIRVTSIHYNWIWVYTNSYSVGVRWGWVISTLFRHCS